MPDGHVELDDSTLVRLGSISKRPPHPMTEELAEEIFIHVDNKMIALDAKLDRLALAVVASASDLMPAPRVSSGEWVNIPMSERRMRWLSYLNGEQGPQG